LNLEGDEFQSWTKEFHHEDNVFFDKVREKFLQNAEMNIFFFVLKATKNSYFLLKTIKKSSTRLAYGFFFVGQQRSV